ncbi:hypothetical protein HY449_00480 [Candidatus Pacearchaeota archaeon]|nr:hypothetical protein [Candidatus Pacearchaeota archaeon]
MMNPAMGYRSMMFSHKVLFSEARKRIELYSDGDLVRVYQNCKKALRKPSLKTRIELYKFYENPSYLPHDLFEGPEALSILIEKYGKLCAENLTGVAKADLDGVFNKIFEWHIKMQNEGNWNIK